MSGDPYVPSLRVTRIKAETFGADLTVAEVAYILDADRTTILRYLHDNVIFGYQLGREWRIPITDFRGYVARLQAPRRGATDPIDDWSV